MSVRDRTSLAATPGGGWTDATRSAERKDALMNMLDRWGRVALATMLAAITVIAACSAQTASPSASQSPSAEASATPQPSEPAQSPAESPSPTTPAAPAVEWGEATVPESA